MPKKKTTEIVRKLKTPSLQTAKSKTVAIGKAAAKGKELPAANKARADKSSVVRGDKAAAENRSTFPATFENKAGRYELIRIDGDQAYYSFTNQYKKTVDATMPVITWRKMQERALAAFKETA
jgi:hypothetical protein